MTPKEIIQDISEKWFLCEPPFYALYCLQELRENVRMECGVRVGDGRLEYNPLFLQHKNYAETEQLLRIEMIRLLLKHPYERRPEGCDGEVIALGSDCTIADGYCLLREAGALQGPGYYHLPIGQCYEWYCKAIAEKKGDNGDNDKNSNGNDNSNRNKEQGDNSSRASSREKMSQSELWRDDSLKQAQINDLIEHTTDWGSLSTDIVEQIKASTQERLNPMLVLQGFKSQLLSPLRRLTRMRPNRRTGFLQMGNRRETEASLLLAIDCSGSINDEMLARFLGIVNRLFRDVSTSIDMLQFDAEVLSIAPIKKALHLTEIQGRGGTNFQPVIDTYIANGKQYDALIILTDGEAPPPLVPVHKTGPLLWACTDQQAYQRHHQWMERSGRCCWI